MKRLKWGERQTGDIFLSCVPSEIGYGIKAAELAIHPNAPKDFIPTHAGIVGFNGMVIEAWLSWTEDSVAAINPDSKYEGLDDYLEVWRPSAFDPDALATYIKAYGPERYGLLNLFGFEWMALVKRLTGKDVENPVECSEVCSQGDLLYLGENATLTRPAESWAAVAASDDLLLRDCDPLELRLMLLAHQS